MNASTAAKAAFLLYGSVSLLVAAGCQAPAKASDNAQFAAQRPMDDDVPVPQGASLIDRSSEDHTSGARRIYLRHEYECNADKYEIRDFYRRQMPEARWRMVSDTNIKGEITMRFEKADEVCVVRLTERRRLFSRACSIRLIVSPIDHTQPPPTTRTSP